MEEFDWKNDVNNKDEKMLLAKRMAKRVKNGETIGFGSGSTSYLTIIEIADRIKKEKIQIKAIPTSNIIENLCKELKIETTTLKENTPDWCFDGADEIDSHNWLIKGMGAALYKEKLNMKASNENYILVDNSKFVNRLGEKHPVPIECKKEKIEEIENKVKQLGATNIEIRKSNIEDGPLITDNGNIILHAWFDKINEHLEEKILQIDGVIESGLFIGYDIIVIK
ncbi:MAG: ribose 5-phosphate isomerase A [Clostridiaceae bacterium]|nr:ribose 5-phosphate isomerase A [Clostridiaceae bacterium]